MKQSSDDRLMIRFIGAMLCALLLLSLPARADELHLKDGRVIEADETWESNGVIWYRQGKLIASVARTDVVRITKPVPTDAVKEGPKSDNAAGLSAKSKP